LKSIGEGGATALGQTSTSTGNVSSTGDEGSTMTTTGVTDAAGSYCDASEPWSASDVMAEQRMLDLVNDARSWGVSCDPGVLQEFLPELLEQGPLKCAARIHARDMFERGFFDHVNPEGEGYVERLVRAGAEFVQADEVLGDFRAEGGEFRDVLEAGGDGCSILLSPGFNAVGVGYYQGVLVIVVTIAGG
jgi:uncharacterized protein YkwD